MKKDVSRLVDKILHKSKVHLHFHHECTTVNGPSSTVNVPSNYANQSVHAIKTRWLCLGFLDTHPSMCVPSAACLLWGSSSDLLFLLG